MVFKKYRSMKTKKVWILFVVVLIILVLVATNLKAHNVILNSVLDIPFKSLVRKASSDALFDNTAVPGDKVEHLRERPVMDNSLVNGVCRGKLDKTQIGQDGSWQPVDKSLTMFVISAYYINTEKKIFIIGAKPMYKVTVICQLWTLRDITGEIEMRETDANVGTPNDPAGPLPYTAVTFECKLNGNDTPSFVSLVTHPCQNALNLLSIKNASKVDTYQRHFTVCLAPIFSYRSAHEFIEWVELNRILGVDKVIGYDYSISEDVKNILKFYSERNFTEIIPWRLPFPVQHHIHYFGQTVALNDCLFRTKQISEFMSNIDLDEYIIPHSGNAFNWTQMMKDLDQSADGFIFKNTFFRKEWTNDEVEFKGKAKAKQLKLITLKHFDHETKIYHHMARSKYFVRPSRVNYILIHEIPNARVVKVTSQIGLLHHYRNWENYEDKQQRVKDTTVLDKFEKALISNVESVWKELKLENLMLE
ncbi:uncharacterized protein LOC132722150 isoform X1 [Ruditapes philippinarum]|uniref:uncharacterized protein LOC132722150 isoform X1 n=1 Tax=Ruditapes philippinarum TaxID=129788 RepID=UPI00295A836C|nr:uncharacterized protein LOC132722150 isoform X1 [Ruditapes philippinarum]